MKSRVLEKIWYSRRAPFYSYFLFPFSLIYQIIIKLRRWCYRIKLFKSTRFHIPIIVVGNLTVGGTGKTPIVIAIIELLKQQGLKPGVVSRGYKGKNTVQPMLVTQHSDAVQVGDEPVLIAQRTQVPLVVAKKRVAAVSYLLEHTDCDVIIADDGLQHYALARDVEIAVIDSRRGYGNGFCLPLGPLREPLSRLKFVDLHISVGPNPIAEYSAQLVGQKAVRINQPQVVRELTQLSQPLHAVAGIGDPKRFFNDLRQLGLSIIEHAFPDHHAFTAADIQFVDQNDVVMTEKDAVKCKPFASDLHWYVPVSAHCDLNFYAKLRDLVHQTILKYISL